MNTLIIIPAHNEEGSIERVVDGLKKQCPQYDFVIVNDGSRDATPDICRANGWRFIDLPLNLGLAGAFQAGIKYAYWNGYDRAVQFDGDGQHLPEYMSSLVDELDNCDIAIGSRFVEKGKPHNLRAFGSNILSSLIKLTTGKRILDPTSGMRAYGRRAMAELVTGPNLGPEPDTLCYLMKKRGMTVHEVPVCMAERMSGESYLSWGNSAWYMARVSFSILFIPFFR